MRLIDATIEVIAARGDAAVRLTEVAKEAGIAQSSIYCFFASREELMVAAHRERYRRTVAEGLGSIEAAMASATSEAEFMEGAAIALETLFSDQWRERRLVRLALLARALTDEELRLEVNDAAHQGHEIHAQILDRAQRAGWIRDDVSALTLALWVRSLVFGRLVIELDPGRYDGAEWNRMAISSILRGLAHD